MNTSPDDSRASSNVIDGSLNGCMLVRSMSASACDGRDVAAGEGAARVERLDHEARVLRDARPGQGPDRTNPLVEHLIEARLARGEHVEAARVGHAVKRDAARLLRVQDLKARAQVGDLRWRLCGARVVLGAVGEEEHDVVALPVGAVRVVDAVHGLCRRSLRCRRRCRRRASPWPAAPRALSGR